MAREFEKRLPIYAAIATPILVLAGATCDGKKNNSQLTTEPPRPTLGGEVKPAFITPTSSSNVVIIPTQTASPEPTPQPTNTPTEIPINEPTIDSKGNLIFTLNENGQEYTYSLYPYVDLGSFVAGTTGIIEDERSLSKLSPDKIPAIKEPLVRAWSKYTEDPNDPEIIYLVLSATINLIPNCTNSLHKAAVRAGASYIYQQSPEFWHQNESKFFTNSNCDWYNSQ